ncbi:MAG TPA: LysR family transcriptional regulator [Trebonia sp.]|nr:LysR family transcriptional regulator [Trebonia sp.]
MSAEAEDREPGNPGSELARLASVNLNLLVPLLALVEERSVTKAAARVGLTQPAMSHALVRIRRLLGDEVLIRQGSRMVLTPRGAELVGPLRQALHQTARVVDFPGFDPALDRRVITVAMTTSTAFVIGASIARLLAVRAPAATLRMRTITVPYGPLYTGEALDDLFTEEGLDVVLLSEAFASPFPRERLYDDRWVVVATPAAPAGASTLELLTTLPHVAFDASPRRLLPYSVLDEHQVPYTVRQLVSDSLLVPYLAASSGGVAMNRLRVATVLRGQFGLRVEEFPFPVPGLGIDMVWNPRLSDDRFVAWLRQLLVDAADSLPAH